MAEVAWERMAIAHSSFAKFLLAEKFPKCQKNLLESFCSVIQNCWLEIFYFEGKIEDSWSLLLDVGNLQRNLFVRKWQLFAEYLLQLFSTMMSKWNFAATPGMFHYLHPISTGNSTVVLGLVVVVVIVVVVVALLALIVHFGP